MAKRLRSEGKIISLQLCPGYKKPMKVVKEAEAIENLGLKADTHAIVDSSRQILLIEQESLDELHLLPGQVKENITTKDIALMSLRSHDRLQIGKEVVLEVTKACSPCSRMEDIRPGLIKEIAGRRGMLARVVHGGIMRRGDTIRVLEA